MKLESNLNLILLCRAIVSQSEAPLNIILFLDHLHTIRFSNSYVSFFAKDFLSLRETYTFLDEFHLFFRSAGKYNEWDSKFQKKKIQEEKGESKQAMTVCELIKRGVTNWREKWISGAWSKPSRTHPQVNAVGRISPKKKKKLEKTRTQRPDADTSLFQARSR